MDVTMVTPLQQINTELLCKENYCGALTQMNIRTVTAM
jgi:hypothetical protein